MYLKCKKCGKICKVIVCPKCGNNCLLKFEDDDERSLFRRIYYQLNGNASVRHNKFQQNELVMIRIMIDIGLLQQIKNSYAKIPNLSIWNDIWMDFVEKIN